MPCKHSRKTKTFREGKVRAAKIEMQRFRDILNANPNRKGPWQPRVR